VNRRPASFVPIKPTKQYIPDVIVNPLTIRTSAPIVLTNVSGLIVYDAAAVTNTPTAPIVIQYGWLTANEPTRLPKKIRRLDEITLGRIPTPNPPFISTGWFPLHEQRRGLQRRIAFDGNIVWGRIPPPLPPAISNGWLTPVEPTRRRHRRLAYDSQITIGLIPPPIPIPPPSPVGLIPPTVFAGPIIGSAIDIANRITSLLPRGWFVNTQGQLSATSSATQITISFGPPGGVIGTVISGGSTALSWIYNLIKYVALQTRRATTSDAFIDLGLFDFLALRVRRKASQTDESAREMWKQEVLRRRVTRQYVQKAVEDLTGTQVTIFEPFNPQDTGGIGAQWALNEPTSAFGSSAYPYTMFITAVEPVGAGIPNLSGLDDSFGGFGAGQFALADQFLTTGLVTNQDIYDMINFTRAAGVTCWVNIGPPPVTGGRLDENFILDQTQLL